MLHGTQLTSCGILNYMPETAADALIREVHAVSPCAPLQVDSSICHASPEMSESAGQISIRNLLLSDYDKGYLDLLAQLTTVGDVTKDDFTNRWQELHDHPDYHIAVAEDTSKGKLVGTATLIMEKKFIHSCGKVGHIEDVVVDEAARGQRLGLRLIEELISIAKQQGCYKVILDCAEHNVAFYSKCGLTRKEVQMVKYLDR